MHEHSVSVFMYKMLMVQTIQFQLVDGSQLLGLEATVNFGDSKLVVQLKNAFPQDGQWHHVIFARDRNVAHLGIDPSRNRRKASGMRNICYDIMDFEHLL